MYEHDDDPLERLLRQSDNYYTSDQEPMDDVHAMWREELCDLKTQVTEAEEQLEEKFRLKTIKAQKQARARAKQLQKEMPGAGAHQLHAFITDSNLWWSHHAEKKRRKRLLSVKSSFEQFPEMRRHIFKQHRGSKRSTLTAKQATTKTEEWENERLRKQLKKAARNVLKCTDAKYVHKTNVTKWGIELSRCSMATKILLNKLVPSTENQDRYDGDDFGIDAGLDEISVASNGGSPTVDMLHFLKEKAAFHERETLRYAGATR